MIVHGSLPVWWLARVHVSSGTVIERRPAVLICADEDSSAATVEWNGQRYAVTIDQLKLREENNASKQLTSRTEENTEQTERAILAAAALHFQHTDHHGHLTPIFEHGQWWINCRLCGGQWSVCDAEGFGSTVGFDFEVVTEPDEEGHSR